MHCNSAIEVARLVASEHLRAGCVKARIAVLNGPEKARLVRAAQGFDLFQKLGEYDLFERHFVVVAVVARQKSHCAVMHLCRDRIKHLLGVVDLRLKLGDLLRLLIEAIDDDDGEAGHTHEKHSGGQKARQQLRVHAPGDPSHKVHERLQRPSEPWQPNVFRRMYLHPRLPPTTRETVSVKEGASIHWLRLPSKPAARVWITSWLAAFSDLTAGARFAIVSSTKRIVDNLVPSPGSPLLLVSLGPFPPKKYTL